MKKLVIILLSAALFASAGHADASASQSNSAFRSFVYAQGDKLMDDTGELRFISFNVPCLHYNEDNMSFAETNPWRLPNEFEIADALEAVRQMGGQVVRIYTLSVRRPGEDPNIPRHIIGPGEFDENTFESLDMVLAVANRKGIRVIFPFIDNWKWWGGIEACAAFRGLKKDDFWTDPNLFEDYKKIVSFVINRTNSVTGVKYRDDKAVLAWETGNELTCPPQWTAKAAAFIKTLDKNHLVIDGFHNTAFRDESLWDENIDILTTHHYSKNPSETIDQIMQNTARARGKKPYFVGEFGFIPTADAERVIKTVIDNGVSGALTWSLRFRNRDGGWYWHTEPHGGDLFKAYHWPGFATSSSYDESGLLNLIRRKAFEITPAAVLRQQDAGAAPPLEKPAAPLLLDIKDVAEISWQGSAGAQSYTVETTQNKNGPWQVAGSNISDAAVQYRPLFNDTGAEPGKSYYYRVTAKNSAGVSEPSNIVGPVSVSYKTLVDELRDWQFIYKRNGNLSLETKEARKFKEDYHRLKGKKWAFVFKPYIVYKVEQPINSWKVYSFFPEKISDFKFYASADPPKGEASPKAGGRHFKPVKFSRQDYFTGKGLYGYHIPVLYEGDGLEENAKFLKIEYTAEAQISRVEIKYGKLTAEHAETAEKK
jgi:hypothetical protein